MTTTTLKVPLQPHEQKLLDVTKEGTRREFAEIGKAVPRFMFSPDINVVKMTKLDGIPKSIAGQLMSKLSPHGACMLVVEMWFTKQSCQPDSPVAKAMESGEDVVIIAPHDDPTRDEGVMLQLESKGRNVYYVAQITRPEHGSPILGQWKLLVDSADPDTGRFNHTTFGDGSERLGAGDI